MSEPISPAAVTEWLPDYIPAYLSNGLIGLRAGPIPLIEGLAILSGLSELDPVEKGEGLSRAPYPIGGDIELDGHRLSRLPGQTTFHEQRYDFSCGELHSRFSFRSGEATASVDVVTLCSRTMPTLVLQEMRVRVSKECQLVLTAKVDQTGLGGHLLARETTTPGADPPVVDGTMLWQTHGGLSSCGEAYITRFYGADGAKRTREENDDLAPLRTSYAFKASPGGLYILRSITSLVTSQFHHEPNREATRLVCMGMQRGFEQLRQENRQTWAEIWEGRVVIQGAEPRWQAMADAAFYYLQASAHRSSLFSTSMFGLAYWPNYHYYNGHVMWDVETFAYPTLLLTQPEAAAALLDYRFERLAAAERNAALNGYPGLQFPWASGPSRGEEVIRTNAPLISFEQHVSTDVAFAFLQFWYVTGDEDFLREKAWPVLEGVCDWLSERVVKTSRGYELKEVIGIAEQTQPVDNNAYANMSAAVVLGGAAAVADRLKRPDGLRWAEIAAGMFLAMDGEVIKNHDRFTPAEGGVTGATPEALAGLFPMTYHVAPEVERATIAFYLDRVEPYIGHPMLSAPLAVFAARLGDRRRALDLFEAGYADFVNPPFGEVNEFSRTRFPNKPVVGPLFANLGGFLISLVLGLPGLRLDDGNPAAWPRRPVVLPEGWTAIEVERLTIRGSRARLMARHGTERARLELPAID